MIDLLIVDIDLCREFYETLTRFPHQGGLRTLLERLLSSRYTLLLFYLKLPYHVLGSINLYAILVSLQSDGEANEVDAVNAIMVSNGGDNTALTAER